MTGCDGEHEDCDEEHDGFGTCEVAFSAGFMIWGRVRKCEKDGKRGRVGEECERLTL